MNHGKNMIAAVFVLLLAFTAFSQESSQAPNRLIYPFESREELETFLRTAEIVKEKGTPRGITNPRRLTLSDGYRQCDAIFKSIDDRKLGTYRLERSIEIDFKDSWKFEVAAYEIDKLLSLNMVPVTVERSYRGQRGSLQFWIEGCMLESERIKKKIKAPNPAYWNWNMYKVRIFDNLIYNIDRNLGNLLITPDWKLIAIDHSRSFKSIGFLKSEADLQYFSRSLMEALTKIDEPTLEERCDNYLTPSEIRTTLNRRDEIVELYNRLVKEKGRGITFP